MSLNNAAAVADSVDPDQTPFGVPFVSCLEQSVLILRILMVRKHVVRMKIQTKICF